MVDIDRIGGVPVVMQMLLDEDGEVTLTCDFCRNQERFDAVDLAEMIRESN